MNHPGVSVPVGSSPTFRCLGTTLKHCTFVQAKWHHRSSNLGRMYLNPQKVPFETCGNFEGQHLARGANALLDRAFALADLLHPPNCDVTSEKLRAVYQSPLENGVIHHPLGTRSSPFGRGGASVFPEALHQFPWLTSPRAWFSAITLWPLHAVGPSSR